MHAAQGLKCSDDRMQAPRCDLVLKFLIETLESFGMFANGTDICLKDDGCVGVGQPTSESHLRWAGPQVARPVSRISRLSNRPSDGTGRS
jgi:hypothetical protein